MKTSDSGRGWPGCKWEVKLVFYSLSNSVYYKNYLLKSHVSRPRTQLSHAVYSTCKIT